MSIEKKSLISTLKTTKKANVAVPPPPRKPRKYQPPSENGVTNVAQDAQVTNRRPKMASQQRRPKRADHRA